jgi:hypothetical protein
MTTHLQGPVDCRLRPCVGDVDVLQHKIYIVR